jgi:hypothetical protein
MWRGCVMCGEALLPDSARVDQHGIAIIIHAHLTSRLGQTHPAAFWYHYLASVNVQNACMHACLTISAVVKVQTLFSSVQGSFFHTPPSYDNLETAYQGS